MHSPKYRLALMSALFLLQVPAEADEDYIAGSVPDERPANAPKLVQFDKPSTWYCRALTGISQPYPPSLRFLEDQGGWYSPFIVAGMTGPYDIRNWHGTAVCGKR